MSDDVIDLTTPQKPEVVNVDDNDDDVVIMGVGRGAVRRERPLYAPAPSQRLSSPPIHAPKRVCAFGVRCNRMTDREHLLNFSHADNEIRPLVTLALPVNMFGGVQMQQNYLLARQRELERQERELVAALEASKREEAEARERKKVRDMQDAEYKASLAKDKKLDASKRQKTAETICVEEEGNANHVMALDDEIIPQTLDRDTVFAIDPEPDAKEDGVVSVTLQLLDGSRHSRKFRGQSLASQVYAYAMSLMPSDASKKIDLVRLPEGKVNPGQTIASCGVARILLFVKLEES